MSNLAIENASIDHRIRAMRFLPGSPGGLPSINFRGYEDTGLRYDPNTKSIIMSFDGTDVYTFDDTGGFSATVISTAGTEDSITAFAGGGKASATALSATKSYHRIATCATAGDSVLVPASATGQHHFIRNDGAAAAQVFGAGTDTINGVATGTGVSLPAGTGVQLYCVTAGNWVTTFLASAPGVIGATTAAAAFFTAVNATSIGATTPGTGVFTTLTIGAGGSQAILQGDAANALALRNSTNAQVFNVYNTYTDASNYEKAFFRWNSNVLEIGMLPLGTGTPRDIHIGSIGAGSTGNVDIYTSSSARWRFIGGTGHIQPQTDVSFDLGDSTHFARDCYIRRRIGKIATVTYSASMTPDASLGEYQEINATNGTAFTINAPTNPLTGQCMNVKIKNTSGGALGAVTWNAVFKLAAWTSPATAFNRSIEFYYDGTNWIEFGRTTVDVPN